MAAIWRGGLGRLDHGDEALELVDRGVDVELLLGEQVDPGAAFFEREAALRGAVVVDVVKVDHLADLGEREADPLAAQDPGEAGAVAPRIDAGQALALRRDQALVLVEAERAGGDSELVAKLGDGVALRRPRLAIVGMERGLGH